jgi:hypothetical protein
MTRTLFAFLLVGIVPHCSALSAPYNVKPCTNRARALPPKAALQSYAAQAAGMFGNIQGTAALIAGGLVPLSSFAGPRPEASDSTLKRRLKRLHLFIACTSLVSQLLAVMYATLAKNMLAEAVVPATHSLKALLLGEYALAWVGCNAHFLLGLFGFVSTVALNGWLSFGCQCTSGGIGPALTCGVASALLLMLSAVNRAVVHGVSTG